MQGSRSPASHPFSESGLIFDRYQLVQNELAHKKPSGYPARRSCLEAQIEFLREAQIWRMRMIELTLAGIIFFWLGFEVAARCL